MKALTTILMAGALIATLNACNKSVLKESDHAVRVKVMNVGSEQVNGELYYSGTVVEESGVSLSFATAGTLRSINVDEGQEVGRGQLIATLDGVSQSGTQASAHAVTEQARAALQQAQDTWRRSKNLHEAGVISDSKWVEAQNALATAQAGLKSAQALERVAAKGTSDTRLTAPFSGYVSQKSAEVGQTVVPEQMVVKLVHIDRVKIKVSVPEEEIDKVKTGDQMMVRCQATGGNEFYGRVVEKGVTADPLSRTYEVKLLVDNPGHKLLPGMICNVYMGYTRGQTSVFVPATVIQLNPDNRMFVWVVQGGKASKRFINYVSDTSQGVRVNGGLEPGDQLIVEGQQNVSEGTPCEIVK